MAAFGTERRRGQRRDGQRRLAAGEGQALVQTLHRLCQLGEPTVGRLAERALRQVLMANCPVEGAEMARNLLCAIAEGPEPQAALIARACRALRAGGGFGAG